MIDKRILTEAKEMEEREEKFLWLIIILLNLYKVVFHKKVLVISYKKKSNKQIQMRKDYLL